MNIIIGATIVIVLAVVLWMAWTYNRLVEYRNRANMAWGQVEVQLQRRFDLVPNLVATVKGYASHEAETLEAVTKARQQVQTASEPDPQVSAENFLSDALRQIFALSEAYPDLKADRNFRELQSSLESIESNLSVARQIYNDAVYTFNTSMQQFPTVVVVKPMGFKEKTLFDAPPSADEAPSVQF